MGEKYSISAVLLGVKAGLISSLCCITPLVLILLGIGSVSAALSITQYRPYFIAASLIFLAGALWYQFKRRCSDGTCSVDRKSYALTAVGVYLIIFAVLLYAVVPAVSSYALQRNTNTAAVNTADIKTVHLQISGITCPSCADIIEDTLMQTPGIIDARVALDGSGVVRYDSSMIGKEDVPSLVPEPYVAVIKDE